MSLKYFLREVYINFKRNILMNLTAISTFLILSIILGFFFILIWNLNHLTEDIVGQLRIVARLERKMSFKDIERITAEVKKNQNVMEVKYVSEKKALEKIQNKLKGQIDLTNLKTNPLPSYMEIKLNDYALVEDCAKAIEKIKGIEAVKYGENIISKIIQLNQTIRIVGISIIILLILSTTFIVSNTIKLTIYARRKEIRIMQLVGAANWFIRWPFILEGILQGIIGGITAIILLYLLYPAFYHQMQIQVPFIPLLSLNLIIFKLTLYIIIIAVILGALGSFFSINKFLEEV